MVHDSSRDLHRPSTGERSAVRVAGHGPVLWCQWLCCQHLYFKEVILFRYRLGKVKMQFFLVDSQLHPHPNSIHGPFGSEQTENLQPAPRVGAETVYFPQALKVVSSKTSFLRDIRSVCVFSLSDTYEKHVHTQGGADWAFSADPGACRVEASSSHGGSGCVSNLAPAPSRRKLYPNAGADPLKDPQDSLPRARPVRAA